MTSTDRAFDLQMMAGAVAQARRGRPSPAPPEGVLIVNGEGKVVAEAFRAEAIEGSPVVTALDSAGEDAVGGTLYCTLEPSNESESQRPPVEEVLKAGVKRVVIGCTLPESIDVAGSAERMAEAGLEVDTAVGAAEARLVVAPWLKFVSTGRPYVGLKLALSLDGRIASRGGVSKWVTGPEARVKVQQLRSMHDAVGVGIGTALADDPRLTVRDDALLVEVGAPVRIIFDTKLRLPLTSRVVETASEVATWVCTGEDAPEDAEQALVDLGCTVMRVPQTAEGRIDILAALSALGDSGLVSILVEGGAELAGTLLAARLADELHAFIAPIMLGPRGRPGAVDWAGPQTPSEAPRVTEPMWEVCGQDAYVHGRMAYPTKD